MRFTREKYPLLYKEAQGDAFFNYIKLFMPSMNAFYYTSNTLISDAMANVEVLIDNQLKRGNYVIFDKDMQYVVTIDKDAAFYENNIHIAFLIKGKFVANSDFINGVNHNTKVDKNYRIYINGEEKQPKDAFYFTVNCVLSSLLFIWYAPIKQKICPPKRKLDLIHCKYKSDIDYPIIICDETWYAECAQRMPFWVRGHLRKQPCGIGGQQRKVIWINPFVKRDYTKGAMIEGNAKQRKERKKIKVFGISGKPKHG